MKCHHLISSYFFALFHKEYVENAVGDARSKLQLIGMSLHNIQKKCRLPDKLDYVKVIKVVVYGKRLCKIGLLGFFSCQIQTLPRCDHSIHRGFVEME